MKPCTVTCAAAERIRRFAKRCIPRLATAGRHLKLRKGCWHDRDRLCQKKVHPSQETEPPQFPASRRDRCGRIDARVLFAGKVGAQSPTLRSGTRQAERFCAYWRG